LTIASASVEGTMLISNVIGNGMVMTGDALTVLANPTNATIAVASAGLSVATAGSLEATPGGLAVRVSGSNVAAGLVVDAGGIAMNSSIGGNRTFEDNVTINGNLTVVGSSVEIQTGEFVVTSSIKFEGTTPDSNEIELTSADPTAARTITLPDLSGHIPLLAGAVSNADVTAAEFGLEQGAGFALSGTINSIVDSNGEQRVSFYQVDLKLIDMTTNREVWNGQKKIKKLADKGFF